MKKPYYNQEQRNEIKEGKTLRATQMKVRLALSLFWNEFTSTFPGSILRIKRKKKIKQAFIQWKGTDVCLDFHCECGCHNHYDGYFAYRIQCQNCIVIYELNPHIEVKISEDQTSDALEPEHFRN